MIVRQVFSWIFASFYEKNISLPQVKIKHIQMAGVLQIPLHDFHAAQGARFVAFGGWNMPVQYTSILEEHKAVREAAGLFDKSPSRARENRGRTNRVQMANQIFFDLGYMGEATGRQRAAQSLSELFHVLFSFLGCQNPARGPRTPRWREFTFCSTIGAIELFAATAAHRKGKPCRPTAKPPTVPSPS